MDPNDDFTTHRLWRGLHKPSLGQTLWLPAAAVLALLLAAGAASLATS